MDLINDLDIFFADFGLAAIISQLGNPDKPTQVLFDLQSVGEMGALTDKPQVTIKDSDLDGVDIKSATITIRNTSYRMVRPLADGMGLTVVTLARN